MASFTTPLITDLNVHALILEARRANGVHVYLDQPHTADNVNQSYGTTIADLSKTASKKLTLTSLVRATEDNPNIAFGFRNHEATLEIEVGMPQDMIPYGSTLQNGNSSKTSFADAITWKGGVFKVFTLHFTYPHESSDSADVTVEIDGVSSGGKSTFQAEDGLKSVAETLFNHVTNFARAVVLEHHILYRGITAALPRDPDKELISTSVGNKGHLPSMSTGGWAVIVGSYIDANQKYDGIMVGYYRTECYRHVFSKHKTKGVDVVFRLSVTEMGVRVVTEDESKYIRGKRLDNAFIAVVLDNIDIKNLEMHTGRALWTSQIRDASF
ncbi:uncharacterized protein [Dermacentor andersoni]|uniref:uncharacterized protein n=1 Tax=Dermacentor andersoni TaxID=34620 RepID=UPI0024165CCA|nr:uncharacterized protein LOC129384337 [Dermacentor andersoni]